MDDEIDDKFLEQLIKQAREDGLDDDDILQKIIASDFW